MNVEANSSPKRFPRVLFFTAGMTPTPEEYQTASKFAPNYAFRNASQVAAVPHSPIEECDAVAGAVPGRYAAVYPDVNDFDPSGGLMLRMSDLDRRHGRVSEVNNEAARAAKPPAVGGDLGYSQGAPRSPGGVTMADGGYVAPIPQRSDALSVFGSERAENAPEGGAGARTNPLGLPEGGVTAVPEGQTTALSTGTAVVVGSEPASAFTAPKPVEEDDDAEAEINPETGRPYTKAQLRAKKKAEDEANA